MAESRDGRNIAQRSSDVRNSLHHLVHKSKTAELSVELRKVEDVLDRFKLWTGNLGALHRSYKRMSLESRLADNPEVKDQICEQLDDMHEAIQDLLALGSKNMMGLEIKDGSSLGTDTQMHGDAVATKSASREEQTDDILGMISECLRALFRIAILVRKATPRDRFARALQQSQYKFDAQFDINYIEERYPKLASKDSSWLATRLGNANSKRRQFINYVRDHRAQLGIDDSSTVVDTTTMRQSSKATTFVVPGGLSTSEFLQSSLDDEDDLASLASASTAFDDETRLRLPRLADLSPDGQYFECPICFTLQCFRKEKAWKLHAYRDLKAYVCTSAAQDCEQKMFNDRDTWFDHELKHHHSLHVCKFCGCQYTTTKLLEKHLLDEHGPYSDEQINSVIEHGKVVPSQLKAQDCPFCDKWASILSQRRQQVDGQTLPRIEQADTFVSLTHFKRHVATHLEQLAIFSMPKAVSDDDERSHGAGDSNSEAISSKDENSQAPHTDDLDLVEEIGEDFKTTVRNMCEELLANPDQEAWNDQCDIIIAFVSAHIGMQSDHEASRVIETLNNGTKRLKAVATILSICPSFATLLEKHDRLQGGDNYKEDTQSSRADGLRVKAYKLINNDWEDLGTGFCRASVRNTETGQREVLITVDSETESGRLIIEKSVHEDDNFQKQQETLIVWTDHRTHTDTALSFQYVTDCSAIWKVIDDTRRHTEDVSFGPVTEAELVQIMQDASMPAEPEAPGSMHGILIDKVHPAHIAVVKEDLDSALGKHSWCWAEELPGEQERKIKLKRELTPAEFELVHEIVTIRYLNYRGANNADVPRTSSGTNPESQDTNSWSTRPETEAGPSSIEALFLQPKIEEHQGRWPASRRGSTQSIKEGLEDSDFDGSESTTAISTTGLRI